MPTLKIEAKEADFKNIENMVYIVNEDCKKHLTRAGEFRTDFIQLCDAYGNPIDFRDKLEVYFEHINKLATYKPELERNELQIGLKWCPTVRGHYYLYINDVRMNPTYELGVCAAQADHKMTKVQ